MVKCWSTNPEDRPSFKSLEDALEVLHEDEINKVLMTKQRYMPLHFFKIPCLVCFHEQFKKNLTCANFSVIFPG